MSAKTPFAVVLRLSGFRFSQTELEERLKEVVDRYSLDKGGYAQLTIEADTLDWKIIDTFLESNGPAIRKLRDSGDLQSGSLDLAYAFDEGLAAAYYTVPAQTAALAGSNGIDVEFSLYLTAP